MLKLVKYMTKVSETNNSQKKPFKETLPRGTIVFPIQYSLCNTLNPYYDLPLHWHEEFEIIRIISGNYTIFISDHEYELKKDDVCIIPGKLVHGDGPKKGTCLYESIVFDIDLVRLHSYSPDNFINEILNGDISLNNVISAENKEIVQTVNNIFNTIKSKGEGYDSITAGYMLILFGLLKKYHHYEEREILSIHKKARGDQIEAVFNLIRKNYSQEITLETMADAANLSPKYFCRLFKDMTDHSPIEYLNWFRINRACSMLRETSEKLPDIADKCGFNDFSYFIKIFRRYKGMTPFKYRSYDPNKIEEIELGKGFGKDIPDADDNSIQDDLLV